MTPQQRVDRILAEAVERIKELEAENAELHAALGKDK